MLHVMVYIVYVAFYGYGLSRISCISRLRCIFFLCCISRLLSFSYMLHFQGRVCFVHIAFPGWYLFRICCISSECSILYILHYQTKIFFVNVSFLGYVLYHIYFILAYGLFRKFCVLMLQSFCMLCLFGLWFISHLYFHALIYFLNVAFPGFCVFHKCFTSRLLYISYILNF